MAQLTIKYTATEDLMTLNKSWLNNNVASSTYDSNTQQGTLTLNDGVTSFANFAFSYITSLLTIEIPEGFTKLGQNVFNGCTSLTTAVLPQSLTKLADESNDTIFNGCSSLTSVNIPNNITTLGSTFNDCSSLSFIDLNNVTTLDATFFGCTSLTSIDLKNVSRLANGLGMYGDKGVFYGCSNLTTVTGNNLTYIGSGSFNGCSSLSTFTIPSVITEIKDNTFKNCNNLLSVTCEATTPPTLGSNNFQVTGDTLYVPAASLSAYQNDASWSAAFTNIEGVNQLVINYTATQDLSSFSTWLTNNVASSTYDSTTQEGTLTLKLGVTEIGLSAFRDCSALRKVTIEEGITSIGEEAFSICTYLSEVTIPQSVTTIRNQAFYACNNLLSVTCLATTPPSLDVSNFGILGDTLYVPAASKSAYQSAFRWSKAFTNYKGLYEVTSTVTGSGSVSPSSTTLNEGDDVTLTITPDEGYGIFSVTDNGTSVHVTHTGMTYTISIIAADHAIAVIFKPLFTIITSAGEGGSITPTMTVVQNNDATVVITPDESMLIENVIDNGTPVAEITPSGMTYTISNIQENHIVEATFDTAQKEGFNLKNMLDTNYTIQYTKIRF